MKIFKQGSLVLPLLLAMVFLFIPISTQALTYDEIRQSQSGQVLGDTTSTNPTGLQNQCNAAGNQATLTWNGVSGADRYLLRINDTSNDNSSITQWGWYTPGTTDINADNVVQTTYTATVVPGKSYTWWVHSYINSSYTASPAVFGNFTCSPPAPEGLNYQCNTQGNQVTLSWNSANGASNYLLRLNDPSNDSIATSYGWYTTGTTDMEVDVLPQTLYTATVIPGKAYTWWVHSQNQINGFASAASFGNFVCAAGTPAGTSDSLVFVIESQYASKYPSYTNDVEKIVNSVNQVYKKNTKKQFTWKTVLYNGINNCDYSKDQRICDELLNNPEIQIGDIPIFVGKFGSGLGGASLSQPRTHIVLETCSALEPVVGPMGNTECDWSSAVESMTYIIIHELGHVFGVGHNGSNGVKDLSDSYPVIQGDLLPTDYVRDPMTAQLGNLPATDLQFGPLSAYIVNNNLDLQKSRKDYEIYPQTIKLKAVDAQGVPVAGASVQVFCAGQYEYSEQIQEKTPRFIFSTDSQGETVLQNFLRPEGWYGTQDTLYVMAANPKILDNACTATLVKVNKDSYTGAAIPVWSFLLRAARAMEGIKVYTISAILNKDSQLATVPATTAPVVTQPTPTPPVTNTNSGLQYPSPTTNTNSAAATSVYPYSSGNLVNDGGTIYFISGTTKIPFTNWQAFVGLSYSSRNIVSGDLSNYTPTQSYFITTANAAHPWGSWLLYNGTVYYFHESGLIGVPSWDVFINNGGDAKYVVRTNSYDTQNLNVNLPILTTNDPRVYK